MGNIISNTVNNHGENVTSVANWISQINLGENKVYDIATHHGITFKDGSNDNEGVTWNGLTDLEIVIPNVADIVQTPIDFVGTVGADGTPKDSQGKVITPAKGNLVFITANCNFGGHVCEQGDMAIYDGEAWKVVSGENEVMLVAPLDKEGEQEKDVATVAISSTDKQNVLTVAGKTLALTFDANSLKREKLTTSVESTGTVPSKYIKITKDDDNTTIGEEKAVAYVAGFGSQTDAKNITATANSLVKSVTFPQITSAGEWPTIVKNTKVIDCTVGGTLSKLSSSENEGDFIDDVSITITKGNNAGTGNSTVSVLDDITAVTNSGKQFLTGLTQLGSDSENADIIIPTITASNNTYITGLKTGTDVVVEVSGGTFKDGETVIDSLAYGFSTNEADTGEVLSNVTSDGVTASVVGNVLNLTSSTLTKKYKTLTKAKYTGVSADKKGFNTGTITTSNIKYQLDKGYETTYTPVVKHLGIDADLSWGSYTTSGISVSIPTNKVGVSLDGGAFPIYGNGDVQYTKGTEVIGNVSNNLLDVRNETINSLTTTSVNVPTYTLANDSDATSEGNGTIAVGNPTTITVNGTVDTSSFVTGA